MSATAQATASATTSAPARWANMSTRKAFVIHLTISLLVFSSLIFVMLMWWFPGELFLLDGGWQGLKIVALIDLILGPLLTLVLYKPGKKNLAFDMSCVAAFQIVALSYGFYATYQQRTVAVVFADRSFITLSADSAAIAKQELITRDIQPNTIAALDDSHPAMLLTPEPAPGEFGEYMSQLFSGYPEQHERLDLFVKRGPEHAEFMLKRAATQEKLALTGADVLVAEAIKKGNFDADDILVHFYKARYSKGLVLFSKSEQKILDYLPIPWDKLIEQQADETDVAKPKNGTQLQKELQQPAEMAESLEQ